MCFASKPKGDGLWNPHIVCCDVGCQIHSCCRQFNDIEPGVYLVQCLFSGFHCWREEGKRCSTDKETHQLKEISPELFWGGTKIAFAWLVQKTCFSIIAFPLLMLQCLCRDLASSCTKILVLKISQKATVSSLSCKDFCSTVLVFSCATLANSDSRMNCLFYVQFL